MKRLTGWLAILAISALGFLAYSGYSQYEVRTRLYAQLQQLNQVLQNENNEANNWAADFVKGIEAKVVKNQRQAKEVAILQTCQSLRARTATLLDTLFAHRMRMLRLTGNPKNHAQLLHPDAAELVTQNWGRGTSAQQALAAQFATYSASLPLATDSLKIAPPTLDHQPVAAALATLAQTESDLLAAEMQVLRHFEHRVGARKLSKRIIAVTTAESSIVRPGTTYRARFYLAKQLTLSTNGLRMQCDGKPVPIDHYGVGHVQFQAPKQRGTATWTGSIHFNVNGRDTTFQVKVPYRVARR